MRCLNLAVVGCGSLAVLAGCDWNAGAQTPGADAAAASSVAIVDLHDVLQRLGRDTEMNEELETKREELRQLLAKDTAAMQKEFADKKQQFGEEPTEEQQKELQALGARITLVTRQAQAQYNADFNTYRQQLINKFREQVKPVASAVAKERNALVVLARDDGVVLAYDAAVDITDDVVARMLNTPAGAAPPAKKESEPAKDESP
jgi:Skp family chaperone for outer membrane proteins